MLEAHEYKIIDRKRAHVEEAKVFAYANNGKKLTAYERALDLREERIGKTDEEIKQSKAVKAATYRKQKADLAVYLSGLKTNKTEELNIQKDKEE